MKVKELIAKLQKLDQDIPVVIRGNYNGFEDIFDVETHNLTDFQSWTQDRYTYKNIPGAEKVTVVSLT